MKFFIMQMMQQYHRDQEVKKNFDTEMLTKKADLQVFSEVQVMNIIRTIVGKLELLKNRKIKRGKK